MRTYWDWYSIPRHAGRNSHKLVGGVVRTLHHYAPLPRSKPITPGNRKAVIPIKLVAVVVGMDGL
jgi:hypothetical protein